jgi:hypothetical protein
MISELLEGTQIDAKWAIIRWIEQTEASPLDYFEINQDGGLGDLKIDGLSNAQKRNLKSIKVTRHRWGESITVSVCDQQRALASISKLLGLSSSTKPAETSPRVGDLIEKGVKKIRKARDAEAWKEIFSPAG